MKLQSKPTTIILTSLFSLAAGAILISIDSWYGYGPLAYGVIMLLVGFVAATRADPSAETDKRQ